MTTAQLNSKFEDPRFHKESLNAMYEIRPCLVIENVFQHGEKERCEGSDPWSGRIQQEYRNSFYKWIGGASDSITSLLLVAIHTDSLTAYADGRLHL